MANESKKECHCMIRHPRSAEERKRVVEALSYARSVGDTVGIMLTMAQLGACASDR